MLYFVFYRMGLGSKPMWKDNILVLFLVGLINGMEISATWCSAKYFVRHLVLDYRKQSLIELQ